MRRHRHCIICNREFPKSIGHGIGRSYCTAFCQARAWADWIESVRRCRFIACDCPGDRWHDHLACRRPRIFRGRCLDCGHEREAHQRWPRRRRSSWRYDAVPT